MDTLQQIHKWHWGLALLLALGVWLLVQPVTAWACGGTVLCVDADATTGAATGLSWTDAYTTVQDALAVTNANGSTNYEIWVATGVYTPGNARTDAFRIAWNNVQLYGGFAGDESARDARDPDAHPTILSGDLQQDDTTIGGVVTATDAITGVNAYHVLWLDGVTNEAITGATVIDGFTITAGQADDNYLFPHYMGGGLYCAGNGSASACSPVLTNVTFSGNQAYYGGGMYNDGYDSGVSSPALTNVTFSGNQAGYNGGGMFDDGSSGGDSSPVLTNVTFSGNQADYGGGMYNYGYDSGVSSPALTNVTFSGNQASQRGGGMYNYGTYGVSSPSLTHVTFSGNQATGSGGGMFNNGSGGVGSPTLTNVTFSGNQAGYNGGGMYNNGINGVSSPALTNVTFSGNQAALGGGGGMYNDGYSGDSSPVLTNVTFSGNQAALGGGMYNDGSSGGDSSPALTNVTFSGNQASGGGGMYNYGYDSGVSSPNLTNVILWDNDAGTGAQLYNYYATPTLSYTLIQSDTNAIYNDGGSVSYGPGILTADPRFVAPVAASSAPTTTGDYRLQRHSPAIDAGNPDPATCPATDLRGLPRADLRCDIGAFELQYADSDTVVKSGMTDGKQASFGPTRVRVTVTGGDAGTITATKHLATPGGLYDTGEITATWWLTASQSPFTVTLALCYTEEDIAGLTEAKLRAFRWYTGTGGVLTWTDPISTGLTVDEDANCVILTGIEGFSAWTLKDGSVGADKPTAARVVGLAARSFVPVAALLALGGAVVMLRRRR